MLKVAFACLNERIAPVFDTAVQVRVLEPGCGGRARITDYGIITLIKEKITMSGRGQGGMGGGRGQGGICGDGE